MTEATTIDTAEALPAGVLELAGKKYMTDPRGALVPLESIKPADKLQDELVRKIFGFAEPLSAQIGRFLTHTMADLDGLDDLLAQQYQVTRRGTKGNRTYLSYDGLMKVQVQVADLVTFGPELQQAKALLDECMLEWTADGRSEIRTIITRAFSVEKEGNVNQADLFKLLRYDIEDERWQRAMQAITDAIRPIGSKQYVRFYKRARVEDGWEAVTIDLAKA